VITVSWPEKNTSSALNVQLLQSWVVLVDDPPPVGTGGYSHIAPSGLIRTDNLAITSKISVIHT
jgi:hypothetical protein